MWLAWPLLWKLAQRERPYGLLYESLLLWNFIGCYWLLLTSLSAPDMGEALLSIAAGAAAILLNPLLMLLPFWAWRVLSRRTGAFSPWLFIPLWGLFEYLHFRWELTWSWLNLGFAWSSWPFWEALGRLWGPVGLSLWTLIGAAVWQEIKKVRLRIPLFLGWVLLLPAVVWGWPPSPTQASPRPVWVLQPNIDPYAKFSDFPPEQQVERLRRLFPPSPPSGGLIVGPETTIPLPVDLDHWRNDPFLRPFVAYADSFRVNVLLGVVGYRYFPPGKPLPVSARPLPEGGGYEMYNAALLLRPDTAMVHIKGRLVPFVERAPYLEFLHFLKRWQIDLGGGFGHFGRPDSQPPLRLYPDELPVAVSVCYESIFAHDLRRRLPASPALLAILTNDGWWKKSSGYWQHFSWGHLVVQSLGVSAARSANTGVSALLKADGDPIAFLPYDTTGVISGQLVPQAPATLYYRFGEGGAALLATFALALWIHSLRSRRFSKPSTK